MSEPSPAWQLPNDTDLPMPEQLTPTYSDMVHYAAIGLALTQLAGYSLEQRPPLQVVLRAIRRQGAALQTSRLLP